MTREELKAHCEKQILELLYQEPTTKNDLGVDCISRIETIDYLCKHCPDDGECFKDCDEIKHLRQMPSVTPQEHRWILINEKLPEEKINPTTHDYYEYQCTFYADGIYDVRSYKFGGGHWWNGAGTIDDCVIAWRELPEPYKGGQEDGKA